MQPPTGEPVSCDVCEAAGVDGSLRCIQGYCMEDDCDRSPEWRSDDGYGFCNWHGYQIYQAECEMEGHLPMTASLWMLHGRPHGPLG